MLCLLSGLPSVELCFLVSIQGFSYIIQNMVPFLTLHRDLSTGWKELNLS